jgi:hypothetical protein
MTRTRLIVVGCQLEKKLKTVRALIGENCHQIFGGNVIVPEVVRLFAKTKVNQGSERERKAKESNEANNAIIAYLVRWNDGGIEAKEVIYVQVRAMEMFDRRNSTCVIIALFGFQKVPITFRACKFFFERH